MRGCAKEITIQNNSDSRSCVLWQSVDGTYQQMLIRRWLQVSPIWHWISVQTPPKSSWNGGIFEHLHIHSKHKRTSPWNLCGKVLSLFKKILHKFFILMVICINQERLEDKNVLLAKIGAIICRVHSSKLLRKDVNCEITLIFMLISSKFK